MMASNFIKVESGVSSQKLNLLVDEQRRPCPAMWKVIKVRRGTELIFTKTSHDAQAWTAYDVMKKKFNTP